MDLRPDNRHALVCGASQGIGLATARELAALGARVTVLARRGDRLDEVVAGLPGEGHDRVAADTSDTTALAAAASALAAERPVHILVNNSGGPPPGPLHQADASALEAAMRGREADAIARHLQHEIKTNVGTTCRVDVREPGSIERSVGKARRIVDERPKP